MSGTRVNSFTDLAAPSFVNSNAGRADEHTLGLASHVVLLLKLIQDHNEASSKGNDERKKRRLARMMTIIDDVKTRIQKSESSGRKAELRRSFTELRPERKPDGSPIVDEKERLRKELHASLTAKRNLEILCSSLGKEKEIMAVELSRKVQELNAMEELVNDLKAQNEMLLAKVQAFAMGHREKKAKCDMMVVQDNNTVLQERNKDLSEQLLRSLEKYKALKRKLREAQEENMGLKTNIEELSVEIVRDLNEIRGFKQQLGNENEPVEGIEEKVSNIESTLKQFELKISKFEQGTRESKHELEKNQ